MNTYHFALRNDRRDKEDLGYMALPDDSAAIEFGNETIRLIMTEADPDFAVLSMEITAGTRTVDALRGVIEEVGQIEKAG